MFFLPAVDANPALNFWQMSSLALMTPQKLNEKRAFRPFTTQSLTEWIVFWKQLMIKRNKEESELS